MFVYASLWNCDYKLPTGTVKHNPARGPAQLLYCTVPQDVLK